MTGAAQVSKSRIARVNLSTPDKLLLKEAIDILNNDGLIVAPTETRYGILAKVESAAAARRLFEVKGRDSGKPSAIFVSNVDEIAELAELPPKSEKLCQKFLPGPLTIVLKAKKDFGMSFTQNKKTGFRISPSPIINSLVNGAGFLSATSANLSGQPEPDTVSAIYAQLGDKIDLYLDAGSLNNPPSTVVEFIDDKFRVLREGAIPSNEIKSAVE